MAKGRSRRLLLPGVIGSGRPSLLASKKGVHSDRFLRNLKGLDFRMRLLDTKVSRLESAWPSSVLKHSNASAYEGVSKGSFEASAISIEEWSELLRCCHGG